MQTPTSLIPRQPRGEMRKPGAAAKKPESATGKPPWDSIESADPAQFIANLRIVGCPERTIRDIVALRVCRAFRARLLEIHAAAARSLEPHRFASLQQWREQNARASELRNDMISAVEALFPEPWEHIRAALRGAPTPSPANSFLSTEKRRRIRKIEALHSRACEPLRDLALADGMDREDREQVCRLERERIAALGEVLSPDELEDYLCRRSAAADYVRLKTPGGRSEQEFRVMVRIACEMELIFDERAHFAERYGIGIGVPDPAAKREADEKQALFEKRVAEVLGTERIAQMHAEERQEEERQKLEKEKADLERERQRLIALAARANIGVEPEEVNRFCDRVDRARREDQARLNELIGNEKDNPEKIKAVMKAELERMAVKVMGEKGRKFVEVLVAEMMPGTKAR